MFDVCCFELLSNSALLDNNQGQNVSTEGDKLFKKGVYGHTDRNYEGGWRKDL